MRATILLFILFMSAKSFAQNDHVMLSRTRPLLDVEVNGHKAAMLLDTGSELNLINKSMIQSLGVDKHSTEKLAFGAGGNITIWKLRDCSLRVKGFAVSEVFTTDLDATCKSIENTAGIKVVGILGAPAIKELGMIIDLRHGMITFKK